MTARAWLSPAQGGRPSHSAAVVALQERICGLLCVLVLALRALTLFECVARRSLQQRGDSLPGFYAGNPKRATERPTTERLLKAFEGLTLYRFTDGETT